MFKGRAELGEAEMRAKAPDFSIVYDILGCLAR
jgi:hypothetical protein